MTTTGTWTWVHPSWRDVVIDHLMSRPADRLRFLGSCSVVGLQLALSLAGGGDGRRELPLLHEPADWQALRTRVGELIDDMSLAEHNEVLSSLRSLLDTITDADVLKTVGALTDEALSRIVRAWDERKATLTRPVLANFYELSVQRSR